MIHKLSDMDHMSNARVITNDSRILPYYDYELLNYIDNEK